MAKVFDWCEPWRPKSQHRKCKKAYSNVRGERVRCECPACNHEEE